jgi:hypothetical protein
MVTWKRDSSSLAKIIKACADSSTATAELRDFVDVPNVNQALFRLIDDYLFITTSLPKAKSFLEMMNKGVDHSVPYLATFSDFQPELKVILNTDVSFPKTKR